MKILNLTVFISSFCIVFSAFGYADNSSEDASAYRAFNSPVNYNYGGLGLGKERIDGSPLDATSIVGGGEGMINKNWIYNVSYSGLIMSDDYLTSLSNAFSFGLNYRIPLNQSLDFVVGAGIAYLWYEIDTYYYNVTDNDLGFLVESSLRYGLTESLEGSIGVAAATGYGTTTTTITNSLTVYPTHRFGLGLSLAYSSAEVNSSNVSAHIKFNFN